MGTHGGHLASAKSKNKWIKIAHEVLFNNMQAALVDMVRGKKDIFICKVRQNRN